MSAPLRAAVERLLAKWRTDAETVGVMGYYQQQDRIDDCVKELEAVLADYLDPADDHQATLDRVVDQLIHDRAGLLGLIGKLIDAKEAAEAKCAAEPGEPPPPTWAEIRKLPTPIWKMTGGYATCQWCGTEVERVGWDKTEIHPQNGCLWARAHAPADHPRREETK